MSTLISVAIIIVCIFLILIVLVQNYKGGGLASSFSSSNQVMGVRKTADFLEKATWSLAIALLVLSLASAAYNNPTDATNKTESATRKQAENAGGAAAPAGTTTLPDTTK
ncbi:MAG TPA: preprotein translocase subunit SecG [Bacteroidia bacterium]|jgi:preprotein translocase subunit SecG